MPHDARGKLLKAGDTVMVPFVVENVSEGKIYCNVALRSLFGMPPEGHKLSLSAINTQQTIRANFGDSPELRWEAGGDGTLSAS